MAIFFSTYCAKLGKKILYFYPVAFGAKQRGDRLLKRLGGIKQGVFWEGFDHPPNKSGLFILCRDLLLLLHDDGYKIFYKASSHKKAARGINPTPPWLKAHT